MLAEDEASRQWSQAKRFTLGGRTRSAWIKPSQAVPAKTSVSAQNPTDQTVGLPNRKIRSSSETTRTPTAAARLNTEASGSTRT